MKHAGKRVLPVCLLLCFLLLLSGCRVRTTGGMESPSAAGASDQSRDEAMPETAAEAEASEAANPEPENNSAEEAAETGNQTRENPDASRKEYDEHAPAEIVAGTDRQLHGEGEGSGTPILNGEAAGAVTRLNEGAEEPVTQITPAEEADRTGVSEDGETADSSLTYYTVLLQDRMGSLYECQRTNVYWETAEDHVTVFRTSPEHTLILNAGSYDVSARLLAENLRVDDGWVVRKNPDVIVKVVGRSVLGTGVASDSAAAAACRSLIGREGWGAIGAVRSRKVLLLSEELLEAPHLQTVAMLLIAKTSNPDLLADVDPAEALQRLSEEATGTIPVGIYIYSLN